MSEKGFRVEIPINIRRDHRATKVLAKVEPRNDSHTVPRLARLLALAHKWEGMVRRGETGYGELARRHALTRGRVAQICSLALLAPPLQGEILASERTASTSHNLRRIGGYVNWDEQDRRTAIFFPVRTGAEDLDR